jgi:transposase
MNEVTKQDLLLSKISTLEKKNKLYEEEIFRLQDLIKLMQYRKFAPKTEKTDHKQLELFDEPEKIEELKNKLQDNIEIEKYTRKKPNRKLPQNLPREKIYYDLKEEEKTCSCGKKLNKFGEDVLEQLEYIPAKLKIIEHIKAKYSCKNCYECVKTAKMPKQPIPKSIASPGLLSQIITSKYVDHLPFYRQEKIYNRIGIALPRATFCNWIFKCAELLKPLYELLISKLISSTYIQADETTVNVLSEKDKNMNYMWVFKTGKANNQIVIYRYDASRNSNVATNFLDKFSGYLQTDGYSGYNKLKDKKEIISVGCFAHARRKFYEITKISKKTGAAHMGLSFIDKLYNIEREIKGKNLNYDKIYIFRQQKSRPILDKFKIWLDKTVVRVPPKTALSKAINYTLNHWKSLTNYCLDGKLDIDNNAVERIIKPFTIGRKNWLFQGNTRGAEASAILYSLVQTCKLNNVEPYDYFKKVLTKIPNIKTLTREDLLKYLPFNYNI